MAEGVTDRMTPILHGPSDKEKKYDRQLRLWAATGQTALEQAHILLLNSGSGTAGVEALKNLVLPGIGKFTIADDAIVGEADLGVNFFLDEDSLGKSRSECCVKLLQELNPDVKGYWFPKQKDDVLEDLFVIPKNYTLIMYSLPIEPKALVLIETYGRNHNIPLISIHSAGFYSYFRIYLPSTFPIVETHPDSTATTDLRLLTPWPELSSFAEELCEDIETKNALDHGHIPFVALLLHFLTKWRESHGILPTTYKDKIAFRETVSAGARTDNAEGGEENFDEAVAAVLKSLSAQNLTGSLKEVFEYQPDEVESVSKFWIIVNAVKQFHAKHNALPLPGSVPDMKAQSTVYVKLQNLYKAKARQDAAEILETVKAHPHGKDIDPMEVETFCKNAAFIKIIQGKDSGLASSIQAIAKQEFENDISATLSTMPLSLVPIYLSLNATSHVPSASSSEILATINKVVPDAASIPRVIQAAEEVARAKGKELHNISALTGGMVAQEAIKVITAQYIPIDNTCIFDGITSRTQIIRV